MASVVVPIEAFRTGLFPRMCVKTGARADDLVDVAARVTPIGAVDVLAAFFPPLALSLKTTPGKLPYSAEVTARRARAVRVGTIAVLLYLGSWAASVAVRGLTPLVVASLAVAIVAGVVARHSSVRAVVVAEGQSVRLTGVTPAFVEAVRGQGLAVDR